jgi:predicted dehydrogenase
MNDPISKSGDGGDRASKFSNRPQRLNIGMLGYAFMGKAHTNALKKIPYIYWPSDLVPNLASICGSNQEAVRDAAARYGYAKFETDWHDLVADPSLDIIDNVGPNFLHAEPCIQAARAGKHVVCEKPLARTAKEAKDMLDAVNGSSVKHMCGFNYRFVPAIRLAKEMIEAGELGDIYHFRARYLQEWIMDPDLVQTWRLKKELAGSGALGDLGSHIVDLARFLVGEPASVSANMAYFMSECPLADGKGTTKVDVDAAFEAAVQFKSGAVGTLEASRFCTGRKNHMNLEINGSKASIAFNLENMNVLQVYKRVDAKSRTAGFRDVLVTEGDHPFYSVWWPHGHVIGWEHTFVHQLKHFLSAIANDTDIEPYGATFIDGYRAAVICDAIEQSAETRTEQRIEYE